MREFSWEIRCNYSCVGSHVGEIEGEIRYLVERNVMWVFNCETLKTGDGIRTARVHLLFAKPQSTFLYAEAVGQSFHPDQGW